MFTCPLNWKYIKFHAKNRGNTNKRKYVENNILGIAIPGKMLYLRGDRLTNSCKV
jgi:hypothetical protein